MNTNTLRERALALHPVVKAILGILLAIPVLIGCLVILVGAMFADCFDSVVRGTILWSKK